MIMNCVAVEPEGEHAPLRCVLEVDFEGMVSVTLLDGCEPQDARYAAEVVAKADSDLSHLTVRHVRTRCRCRLKAATPTRQVNIYDAKSRLSRLIVDIEETAQGVAIARNGRPVAWLLPIGAAHAHRGDV